MSDTTGVEAHPLRTHAVPLVFAAAAFLLLLLPGLLGPYGPFIDELVGGIGQA